MAIEGTTIHDVARLARVSISTVSHVINGKHDRMRPDTLERVRQAIAALGYAPNLMARELKTGYVPVIGLIVPSVANPFWGAFARSVEHAAMARNCQVMLCNSERDLEREERYAETMLARGIRGVILGSSPLTFRHLVGLTRRGLQIVAFDRNVAAGDELELDSVRVDNVRGVEMAVEHLLQLGHRTIAFVCGPLGSGNRRERLDGYERTLRAAGIEQDPRLIWLSASAQGGGDDAATEIGREAVHALMHRPEPPTAFFAINDLTAFGIYAGLRELGIAIPERVSVVGFDDIDLCRVVSPPLSTIRQPLMGLMQAAVGLLVGRLDGSNTGPSTHLTLPPELVLRSSTGHI